MDAQQFLAEFGHIANAPGGLQQLREMVYQLAITGTLTSQLDTDGDAHELLDDISRLRDQLIREKAYKRRPKLEAEALDIPSAIELPVSWCWTRLLDIGEIGPRNDAPDEAAASFIPMSGFSEFHMRALAPQAEKWAHIKKGFTHFRNGDVVVAKITPCFENGKAAVIDGLAHSIGAGTTELHVFRPIHPGILPGYIYLFLRSPYFAIEGEQKMTGTAGQKRLSTEYFSTRALPLPPSTEQSRIVAKVDELMALCDKLEAQQQARRKLQNNLRQSTLQAVASATSPHELQTTWARLADNFGRLFHAPEDVRMLRDVIFDLALRGALLPDVTHEDSADSIADGATPLPDGWDWKTLAELSEYITSGSRGWQSYVSSIGYSFIRSQDIKHDALIFENPAFVSLPAKAEGKRTLVRQGDLLLTITGGNVGKCATVPALNQDAYVSQHVALIRLREPWLAEFIHIWMINAFGGQHFLARYIYGDKPGLNLAQVGSIPIPVPTLSACVAVLERLRTYQAMCEKLERQLKVKQEMAAALVLAAVSSLTGIAIEQENVTNPSEAETV
ncbi:MAG: restriction endonuclease subunit S [Candidatus Accumulibacter meliphilus]|jgi:type I restriction enzyme S subunit|uniref:restriction endonuclease subunit S n=1 Tax=Candidatus Accumulibacter meliphilus TaxID=2211374 RepID=UPI002FC32AC6